MGEYLELLTCVEGRYFLWSVNLSEARYHPAERAYLSIRAVGLWP